MRADSGFYAHAIVAVCRKMDVRFSITIRQHKSLRHLIETIPEDDWTPIPYWMDAADVAETTYIAFQNDPGGAPVRLIVRRVRAHARFPAGPLRQLQLSRFHHRPGRGYLGNWRPDHRRHAEIENAIRDLKYGVGLNHLPSGRFAANPELVEGSLAGGAGYGPTAWPVGQHESVRVNRW